MKTLFLDVKDGRIAYEETGQGPLVICTPGMGDLRGTYRFLLPQLAAAGFRAVSMDLRGQGETSVNWPDYSVSAMAEDILALQRHLDAGPAILIGNSYTGGAAVRAAAQAPERVVGLVLIGPFVYGEGGGMTELLFKLMLARPWGPAIWRKYFSTLFTTRKPDDLPAYTQALYANLKQPGRMEAFQAMTQPSQGSKAEAAERMQSLTVPALVVMGTQDPDFKDPQGEAQWIAEQLHGRVEMIAGAGHYPHAEMPEITGPIIVSFLQSIRQKEAAHAA